VPTILIIEDESSILLGLEDAFQNEGFEVLTARQGELGLKLALQEKFDLLLLDIMLPKLNGFEILKKIRAQQQTLPIILLTAKGQEKDKILGFALGADDYVTKPFSIKELVARVRALLKRTRHALPALEQFTLAGIHLDFAAMTAQRAGRRLDFTPRELELLQYLIARQGEVVSREEILQTVWQYDLDTSPTTRTIDNYIVKLRQKIEKNPDNPRYIVTVHRRGYRLDPEPA
jgi:DNA-binding response OmpR family regulator